MTSSVTWFGSHIDFFLNLQKSSSLKWLNKSRQNFTRMTACPWGTKGSHMISYVTWFGSHIGLKKILNNVFSGTAYSIDVKLHIYDLVEMENTCFLNFNLIGHMVWQPYWIYPQTYKNTPLKWSSGEGLQSLIALIHVLFMFICYLHYWRWRRLCFHPFL